jgi:hypothetical protein
MARAARFNMLFGAAVFSAGLVAGLSLWRALLLNLCISVAVVAHDEAQRDTSETH